jgi:hypothetical protein
MDAKLTLKLDKEVIELAKKYARSQGMSLSRYIEDFLRKRVKPEANYELDNDGLLPEVREAMAKFDDSDSVKLPSDFDYKEAIGRRLSGNDAQ